MSYGKTAYELEYVKALAFKLLMSDEVPSIDGPNASKLFDLVGDLSEGECEVIVQEREKAHD